MKSFNAQSVSPTWAWRCNRGFSAYIRTDNMSCNQECFCLPAYFGHVCQYQNRRVSLTLGLLAVDLRNNYEIVAMLLEEDDHHHLKINSHSQLTFLPHLGCNIKFNIYLLYSTRPENMSKKYSVRIDIFNRNTVTYYASWYLSIPFPFLPVNRLTARLIIPSHLTHIPVNCPLTCYIDKDQFFWRCANNWSGFQCELLINCHDCSSDSICIGSVSNHSIFICPRTKYGPRCLLPLSCPLDACENNGMRAPITENLITRKYIWLCERDFFGPQCQYSKTRVDISFNDIDIASHMVTYFITVSEQSKPIRTITVQKVSINQHTVKQYISTSFHIVFVTLDDTYYLANTQIFQNHQITTSISSLQRCFPIAKLLNSTGMQMPYFRPIKFYH